MIKLLTIEDIKKMRQEIDEQPFKVIPVRSHWDIDRIVATLEAFFEDAHEDFFERYGDKDLMYHNYAECGPGEINVEDLYQAFKNRLTGVFQRATRWETTCKCGWSHRLFLGSTIVLDPDGHIICPKCKADLGRFQL